MAAELSTIVHMVLQAWKIQECARKETGSSTKTAENRWGQTMCGSVWICSEATLKLKVKAKLQQSSQNHDTIKNKCRHGAELAQEAMGAQAAELEGEACQSPWEPSWFYHKS